MGAPMRTTRQTAERAPEYTGSDEGRVDEGRVGEGRVEASTEQGTNTSCGKSTGAGLGHGARAAVRDGMNASSTTR